MQRFLGTFQVMGHEVITGEGIRKGDWLIIFSLVPEPLALQRLWVPKWPECSQKIVRSQ